MQTILVRDWMTPNPFTITPETTLLEADKLMTARCIRHMPGVADDKLVGIVTRGDIRGAGPSEQSSMSIFQWNYFPTQLTIGKVMTCKVVTITPDEPITNAAKLMLERKLGGLPVVDNGHLVGIITESDVFRVLAKVLSPPGQET